MRVTSFALLAGLAGAANAHFRLLFPEPRGQFVADIENQFCGGYPQTTSNRSTFPLTGGFLKISSGHAKWTAGVVVSTAQQTISFDNFTSEGKQNLISPFGAEPSAGSFCIPLNFTSPGLSAVKDGANVTIQVIYDGGDGNLYQCADLTLKKDFTIASTVATCTNATTEAHGGAASSSGSATVAPSAAPSNDASTVYASKWFPAALGIFGAALLAL